jgi:hypothetical protein
VGHGAVAGNLSGYIPVVQEPYDGELVTTCYPEFQWALPSGCPSQDVTGYEIRVRCDEYEWWIFTNETSWGVAPDQWMDDSSYGSPALFRVSTNTSGEASLEIRTRGNTWDRVKVRTTNDDYTIGFYEWKVYVPPINETGACSSIGAFLYSPQSGGGLNAREVDFEIGYGTSADRVANGIQSNELMCYMTVQRDDSSGTSWSSVVRPLEPNDWYYLRIGVFQNDKSSYKMIWWIRREGETNFTVARSDYNCNYGPTDTTFAVECSVENFSNLWIGDRQPTNEKTARFKYVRIYDELIYETGFIPATNVFSHAYRPAAFSGVDPITDLWCNSDPLKNGKPHHWHVRCRGTNDDWTAWSMDTLEGQQDFIPYASLHQWSRTMPIACNGYKRAEALTNYTLLVVLNEDIPGFFYSDFEVAGGRDLLFLDEQSRSLSYEIEAWNTNGDSFVWVRLPVLTSNSLVDAYWGNPWAAWYDDAVRGVSAWHEDYKAVWHLNETNFPYVDSTTNGHDGTTGSAPQRTNNSISGGAQYFNGYNQTVTTLLEQVYDDFTLEAWVYFMTNRAESMQTILASKGSQQSPGFAFYVNRYSTDYTATRDAWLELGNGTSFTHGRSVSNTVLYGAWHHLAAVVDRSSGSAAFYVDGAHQTLDGVISDSFSVTGRVTIGAFTNGVLKCMGTLDELRVARGLMSSNRIWATWCNAASNSAFISCGPVGPAYLFRIQSNTCKTVSGNAIQWESRYNDRYAVERSTNLLNGFLPIATNLISAPPVNSYTDTTADALFPVYYRISRE